MRDIKLNHIYVGDNIEVMKTWPDGCVQMCMTSPPYWNLRDYGVKGQLGLEKTPEKYVEKLVEVFREVKRVLRDDGTLFLNLGDSYASSASAGNKEFGNSEFNKNRPSRVATKTPQRNIPSGLKPKDLVGVPWMVAFALRADGWYLRSDIIWAKKSCIPESVTDRPTKSHEYLFLLTKRSRYYYDHIAILEEFSESYKNDSRHQTGSTDKNEKEGYSIAGAQNPKRLHKMFDQSALSGRNARTVWTIAPQP